MGSNSEAPILYLIFFQPIGDPVIPTTHRSLSQNVLGKRPVLSIKSTHRAKYTLFTLKEKKPTYLLSLQTKLDQSFKELPYLSGTVFHFSAFMPLPEPPSKGAVLGSTVSVLGVSSDTNRMRRHLLRSSLRNTAG